MAVIRKLLLNLGPEAMRALGPIQYCRYVALFIVSLPALLRDHNLLSVDRRMGSRRIRLRFHGHMVDFDCPRIDAIVSEGTYTFGIIRELGIRNCYVRHGIECALENAETVVDLGANRGVFSALAAACGARRIVAVEGIPELAEAVRACMSAIGYEHCTIESTFVGRRLDGEPPPGPAVGLLEVLDRHGIDRVDVLKMDIEGSEFGLFEELGWLERVDAICMEVHPEHGRVQDVLDRLTEAGFAWKCGDHMFRDTPDYQRAEFIWAVRRE